MAHIRRITKYRKRKYERMLERLKDVEFMTLPGDRPGATFKACNVMLDRAEITFLLHVLENDKKRREAMSEDDRIITETVQNVVASRRELRRQRRMVRHAPDGGQDDDVDSHREEQ